MSQAKESMQVHDDFAVLFKPLSFICPTPRNLQPCALQNWMDIIEDLCIEVSHGLVFIKGENWGKALARNTSPQSITSPMPILIERLKQLYRRGLELVDFDLRNLVSRVIGRERNGL